MARTTDMPKATRIAKILVHLIRNRTRQFTVADIVAWLNMDEAVSRRNVERDLKLLADMRSSPVVTDRRANKLTYLIAPDMRDKVSLPVERNGLLALFMLKRLQPIFAPKGPDDAKLGEALAELSLRADADLFEDLDDRLGHDTVVLGEQSALALSGTMLNDVLTALVERRVLETEYLRNPATGPEKKTIRPVKLMLAKGELYFVCVSEKNELVNYFIKLCRITRATATELRFTVSAKALAKVEARLAKSFGILDDDDATPQKVTIRFPGWLELSLSEKRFHATQRAVRDKSGNVLVSFDAPVGDELVKWVLGWAGQAEVVGPKELREMVREAAAGIVKSHR